MADVPAPTGRHPRRRCPRWKRWDYSYPGGYFITIVTADRRPRFGVLRAGRVRLSPAGRVVMKCWGAIPGHCAEVSLDAFVVMPDHVHGIILLGAGAPSLSRVVNLFKAACTRGINRLSEIPGGEVWQRSFHDRIIRDRVALDTIRTYIESNPRRSHP